MMIDKKRIIEGLEKKIATYEGVKMAYESNQDKIPTINFAITELKNIIDEINWGIYDGSL